MKPLLPLLSPKITLSDPTYTALLSTVEKLDFCDRQMLIDADYHGETSTLLTYNVQTKDKSKFPDQNAISWEAQRVILRKTYETELQGVKKELFNRNILWQYIGNYSGRIYGREAPWLERYISCGVIGSKTFLTLGGLSFVAFGIVSLIEYSSSTKLLVASIMFFAAAYVINIAFLLALRANKGNMINIEGEESRAEGSGPLYGYLESSDGEDMSGVWNETIDNAIEEKV